QRQATKDAGRIAGLNVLRIVNEPTAAALAYGLDKKKDETIVVYDFGGGTFDAAVVKVEDGEFTVLNHAGDNFLGGKRVDWALVEDVLIPKAQREYGLTSLSRNNRRAAGAVSKLKIAAEEAKIELSRQDVCDIDLDLEIEDGPRVAFEAILTRADVERAAAPLIERSIMLSRKALSERGLGAGDIERVILVGGMTQAPLLRQMLADPTDGLGIELDHSLDPVTVVARGAAIFAGTQQIPKSARAQPKPVEGQVELGLTYASAGPDLDPAVGGSATRDGTSDWSGYTIEFDRPHSDSQPPWNSGTVPLNADGTFGIRLRAVEGATSVFTVVLRDPHGSPVPVDQPQLSYRQVAVIGGAPTLSHSIGVGLSNNTVETLLPKDRELPSRKRVVLNTTMTVNKDSDSGLIRVPILSGEESKADRNTPIGMLELTSNEVKRSVPVDSEIEVSIKIDTSFQVRADAYIPLLDE
ncbi:MAG: Hsp70 family protein, partial [Stackebrandtia sp.]